MYVHNCFLMHGLCIDRQILFGSNIQFIVELLYAQYIPH